MNGRQWQVVAIAALALVCLTGCQPEPRPGNTATPSASTSPSASVSASPSPTPTAPAATPTPIETERPDASVVPDACEQAYSPSKLAQLREVIPPLNDPGITMVSTQNAELLEMLDDATTLRCTWGAPSEYGLSTNITELDASGEAAVLDVLGASGYGCQPLGAGTVCVIEQRGITQDDVEYANGESHYVGDGGWVATNWLNADISGYTEDIVATLWG